MGAQQRAGSAEHRQRAGLWYMLPAGRAEQDGTCRIDTRLPRPRRGGAYRRGGGPRGRYIRHLPPAPGGERCTAAAAARTELGRGHWRSVASRGLSAPGAAVGGGRCAGGREFILLLPPPRPWSGLARRRFSAVTSERGEFCSHGRHSMGAVDLWSPPSHPPAGWFWVAEPWPCEPRGTRSGVPPRVGRPLSAPLYKAGAQRCIRRERRGLRASSVEPPNPSLHVGRRRAREERSPGVAVLRVAAFCVGACEALGGGRWGSDSL